MHLNVLIGNACVPERIYTFQYVVRILGCTNCIKLCVEEMVINSFTFIYLLNNGIIAFSPYLSSSFGALFNMLDPSFWSIFRFLSGINLNEPMLHFVTETRLSLQPHLMFFFELVQGLLSPNPLSILHCPVVSV